MRESQHNHIADRDILLVCVYFLFVICCSNSSMITIRTRISHSFMFTFNKSPKISVVAIYWQSEYGYLTPSCLSLICDFGSPFWDAVHWHWEHGYITSSCLFLTWKISAPACIAKYSHSEEDIWFLHVYFLHETWEN